MKNSEIKVLKAVFPFLSLLAGRLFSGLKLFFLIATLRIFPNGNRHSSFFFFFHDESDNITWQ